MPIVNIELLEGRTIEQKKQLAREITESFVKIVGTPADAVEIFFLDIPRHNMAKGGKLASES